MFQIKLTKLIKPSRSNRITISRKTDPNRYASVLIITKAISIGSVTNLEKNRANRTVHTLYTAHYNSGFELNILVLIGKSGLNS